MHNTPSVTATTVSVESRVWLQMCRTKTKFSIEDCEIFIAAKCKRKLFYFSLTAKLPLDNMWLYSGACEL